MGIVSAVAAAAATAAAGTHFAGGRRTMLRIGQLGSVSLADPSRPVELPARAGKLFLLSSVPFRSGNLRAPPTASCSEVGSHDEPIRCAGHSEMRWPGGRTNGNRSPQFVVYLPSVVYDGCLCCRCCLFVCQSPFDLSQQNNSLMRLICSCQAPAGASFISDARLVRSRATSAPAPSCSRRTSRAARYSSAAGCCLELELELDLLLADQSNDQCNHEPDNYLTRAPTSGAAREFGVHWSGSSRVEDAAVANVIISPLTIVCSLRNQSAAVDIILMSSSAGKY